MLWKDINAIGESAELIIKSCNLDSLNIGFCGVSLFHYFAPDANIIEVIRKKMVLESESKDLSRT